MAKAKMRRIKVFGYLKQVYIANQTTRHEFDIIILKLYNIMQKYINFELFYVNPFPHLIIL